MTIRPLGKLNWAANFSLALIFGAKAADSAATGLPVTHPTRSEPVDFFREIVPVLQANCLPCHNRTTTKADLRLETPEDMLKGGESGPALVPGRAKDSLLFRVSAHLEKPRMPPKDNKVNATPLTPDELGLLELWINQGAKAAERQVEAVRWQPIAPDFRAIYAVTLSADGQFAACGRANRLFVYHLPTRRLLAELTDPAVARTNGGSAAAHLDVINALAFSPADHTLASAGYREVKLWRPQWRSPVTESNAVAGLTNLLRSADGNRQLVIGTNGTAKLVEASGKELFELRPDRSETLRLGSAVTVVRQRLDAAKATLEAAGKELAVQRERLAKAVAAEIAARAAARDKLVTLGPLRLEVARSEGRLAQEERAAPTTNSPASRKSAEDKLAAARKALEGPEAEFAKAERSRSNAEDETSLARLSLNNAVSAELRARYRVRQFQQAVAAAESARAQTIATPALTAALDPTGRLAATAHGDGSVRLWNSENGAELRSFHSSLANPTQFSLSADGSLRLADAATSFRWEFAPSWSLAAVLGGSTNSPLADRVNALAFSADGTQLAAGGGEPTRSSDIAVWEPAGGRWLYGLTNLHSDAVLALAFSPDGRWLASGGADRFARVTETGSGRQVRALEGHTGHVLTVAWKADGEILASGSADAVTRLWKVATGERLKNLEGFGKEVTGATFLGTGDQLAAAGGNGSVRLLNLKGEEAGALDIGGRFIQSLAANRDGTVLATGGDDGVLRLWSVTDRKAIAEFAP
jgi:WD40 repeat protein